MATQNEVSNERLKSKWITDIGEFAEGTLQNVVSATTSTYLIYLHFRIIHRIYATNRYLFKIRTIEHDTCTFCEEPNETIFHLFWQCPKTQIFIKEILSHLKEKYNTTINVNSVNWFLLTDLTNTEALLVVLARTYIHKARLKATCLSVEAMMQIIKFEMKKEYIIAKRKNRIEIFEQRWGELQELLS